MKSRILIVDDEAKIRDILQRILTEEGFDVRTASNGEVALDCLDSFEPELVVMDQNMPGMDGIETMQRVHANHPDTCVIVLTAFGSIDRAVSAMKAGAYDYLTKPFDNEELIITIKRALEHNLLSFEVIRLKEELRGKYSFEGIIGDSPAMQTVFEQMRQVCRTNATVLIHGESGTGKELVARAIHYNSTRSEQPLLTVNCGAIPETLMESEFFGHEKGAFTDANQRRIGAFERANGGTLFLDEIGELPMDAQVKLLRAIEQKRITRIGGNEELPVDVRIIAATNKDLQEEVEKEAFRLDLYYRLHIYSIFIPPLRERIDDIVLLTEHFIEKYNNEMGFSVTGINTTAMEHITSYNWPGNVRDLENSIQSAMISSQKDKIRIEHLPLRIRISDTALVSQHDTEHGLVAAVRQTQRDVEKVTIQQALVDNYYNRTATARALKISRKTLFNKMKKLNINHN